MFLARTIRPLLAVAVLLLPSLVLAVDPVTIDARGLPDGEHAAVLTVKGGQVIDARPLRSIKLGQGGPTNPIPPVESALSKSVRQLTASALAKGGSPVTAANIAAIYALVSDDCDPAKPAKPGMPQLASPLIVSATDKVLEGVAAGEKAAWDEWRAAVTPLIGKVPGIGTDKDATAKALDEVAAGVQAAINSAAVAEPGILDGINWERIREILKPILEQLLARLIDELLKKLPL
jgi:hypothetical protein